MPTPSRNDRDERPRQPAHHGPCIDAARTIRAALERHRPELERDGSAAEVYERVRLRLDGLLLRPHELDGAADPRACSDSWAGLEDELALLRGTARDRLIGLLRARRPGTEQTAHALSETDVGGRNGVHQDEQGLDPSAVDTWIGSGEAMGQRLLAHELTHVLQKGRRNLNVRTAETEAMHAERSFGRAPPMETLNLSQPQPDFRLADGEGIVHTAKRSRSRGYEAGAKDELPDGEEFLEKVSDRVYALLMDELEQSFESR